MTRVLRDSDADPTLLEGVKVGVVGFGNQGEPQALCLRDQGVDVSVVTRAGGRSSEQAQEAGFDAATPESLAECGIIVSLVSDEAQLDVLRDWIYPNAAPGTLVVFAHGFVLREQSPRFGAGLDVAIVGPLGPGSLLRERFLDKTGLPGLFAVVRDSTGTANARGLAYAQALRLTVAGVLPTTLEEEVVSDLFAEQVVLVGGVVELMRTAWEVLVAGGISEEIAYYSCVQELKQIMDLVHAEGPAGMRRLISGTAKYGGLTRGPRILGERARAEMVRILEEVKSGEFAADWIEEREAGAPELGKMLSREAEHPMERVGRRVRNLLSSSPGVVVDSRAGEN